MLAAPSPAEERLWQALRASQLGVAFKRQVVIGSFIVDFLAPARKLIVEVDGAFHERQRVADARRDAKLHKLGFVVLRLSARLQLSEMLALLERELAR